MKTIDEDIRSGNLKQIYLLYGTEDYLKRQYRDKLKNALTAAGEDSGMGGMLSGGDGDMNFNRFEGKDINPKQVIDLAETLPFLRSAESFLSRTAVFSKMPAMNWRSIWHSRCKHLFRVCGGGSGQAFQDVQGSEERRKNSGIRHPDGRTDYALGAGAPEKEGKNITGSVMQLFLSKTGSDMGNIDRELEKLICYTMDKSVIEAADVEAIATEQTTNRIFEMVNAIAEHNQRRALDLYYDLLTLKEPPMRIMYLITRQFQILLHLRDMAGKGFDNQTMAQKAGIPPFAVKRNLTQARGFGAGQLRQALEDGVALEEAVKTGRMNDQMAVELFIIRYSAAKQKK